MPEVNGQLAGWLLELQDLAAELAELFGVEGGLPLSSPAAIIRAHEKRSAVQVPNLSEGHLLVMGYLIISLSICLIQATEVKRRAYFWRRFPAAWPLTTRPFHLAWTLYQSKPAPARSLNSSASRARPRIH